MTTIEELGEFLRREFPQTLCTIESLDHRAAAVRHPVGFEQLRPGGTVAGPAMMETADVALYVAILNEIGIVPLAVTTSLTMHFLSKPAQDRDIIGRCQLLKSGRRLAVGEVSLYSEGEAEPVAHAVGTYSIPPSR